MEKTEKEIKKKYCSVPFLPNRLQKIRKKNNKKTQKTKKYHYGIISSKNRLENAMKERK